MKNYKNFIFDLYGTLIDIRTDENNESLWEEFASFLNSEIGTSYSGKNVRTIYERECESLLAEPTDFTAREIDIMPVFVEIIKAGEVDKIKNLARQCDTSKISDYASKAKFGPHTIDDNLKCAYLAGEKFRKLSTSLLQLYPNTLSVLKALKVANKKIYLLSNAQRVFTYQELEETGILPYFDDIFISSDEGCKKPDTKFFEALFNKQSLIKEESIMVGNDSTSDIKGARDFGLDALYVRTAISPENDPRPDCAYFYEDGDIGHVMELLD